MILTDREIQIAIAEGHVDISPAPARDAYSPTSVDLTLGRTFATWIAHEGLRFVQGPQVLSIQISSEISTLKKRICGS